MAAKTNPYLHDRFDMRTAAQALNQATVNLKFTAITDEIRSCHRGELPKLARDEMGCKDGVNRNYHLTLSFQVRDLSQSQLPVLQKFGKTAGMVLSFDTTLPGLVRVLFTAYANILT